MKTFYSNSIIPFPSADNELLYYVFYFFVVLSKLTYFYSLHLKSPWFDLMLVDSLKICIIYLLLDSLRLENNYEMCPPICLMLKHVLQTQTNWKIVLFLRQIKISLLVLVRAHPTGINAAGKKLMIRSILPFYVWVIWRYDHARWHIFSIHFIINDFCHDTQL